MQNAIDSIFQALFAAAKDASTKGDKWIVIDCAYAHRDRLGEQDFGDVLARIVALVEQFPQLDFGGPGPFGDLIEQQPVSAYAAALLQSLRRQPSTQVVGWLARIARSQGSRSRQARAALPPQQFALALQGVLRHPLASDDGKSFARECLAAIERD